MHKAQMSLLFCRITPVGQPFTYNRDTKLLFAALVVGVLIVIALSIAIVIVMMQSSGALKFRNNSSTRDRSGSEGGADCPEVELQTPQPTTSIPEGEFMHMVCIGG